MSLLLTDEQKMIRDLAKNFATKKVAPLAAEMDLTGEIHPDLIQEVSLALTFPKPMAEQAWTISPNA